MCARIPSPGPAYPNSPPDRRPHTAAQTLSLKGANLTSRPLFFRSMTAQKEDIAAQNLKVRHDLNQQRLSTRAPHWLQSAMGYTWRRYNWECIDRDRTSQALAALPTTAWSKFGGPQISHCMPGTLWTRLTGRAVS